MDANTTLFVGQDLHSDNVVVCIVVSEQDDQGHLIGRVVKSKRISLSAGIDPYIKFIAPYLDSAPHEVCVESTYNWYWMADLFEERGWTLTLADPATVSRDKTKACNDMTDAHFLAEALRTGTLHKAPIMPKAQRAYRDLVRERGEIIQERARHRTIIKNLFTMHWAVKLSNAALETLCSNLKDTGTPGFPEYCSDACTQARIRTHLQAINDHTERLKSVEQSILDLGTTVPEIAIKLLRGIKGCGIVLSRLIACETGDIRRFASAANYVSYCRLAPTYKLSNNKSKGLGNAKNGNAYLSWAMTELANFVVRYNQKAHKLFDRLMKRHGFRVKAIRAIAGKLARSIWYMMSKNEAFDINRCFA